jgi:CheY-like chemotaxis protein
MDRENLDESLTNSPILIVDDSAINLLALSFTIRKIGYSTDNAASGREALNKLKVHFYAAVMMDVQMPGMNGFECTRQIRAMELGSNCQVPIIGFTSCLEAGIEQMCLDAGMSAYLEKDCSSDRLKEMLKKYTQSLVA